MLGSALDDQGKYEEAIAMYGKALQITPTDGEAYNNLGFTLSNRARQTRRLPRTVRQCGSIPRMP